MLRLSAMKSRMLTLTFMVGFLSVEGCGELLSLLNAAREKRPVFGAFVLGAGVADLEDDDVQSPILAADLVGVGQVAVGVGAGGQPDVARLLLVGGHERGGERGGLEAWERPGQGQGVGDESASPGRVAVPMLVD